MLKFWISKLLFHTNIKTGLPLEEPARLYKELRPAANGCIFFAKNIHFIHPGSIVLLVLFFAAKALKKGAA